MALNDIKVPKENAQGTFTETTLSRSDIGAAASVHTHVSADVTDATHQATADKIVKRDGDGVASFSTVVLSGEAAPVGQAHMVFIDEGGVLSATNASTSRTNLGLGTSATKDAPATGNASSTQVVLGNDSRLSDARTPSSTLAHAASHATAGSDPLAPSDIGAQSLFTSASQVLSADFTLTSGRATKWTLQNYNGTTYNVTLPTTNIQAGDVVVVAAGTLVGSQTIREANVGGGSFVTLATLSEGQSYRFVSTGTASNSWEIDQVYTHTHTASAITSGTLTHERGGLEADVSTYNGLVKISGGSTSAVTVTSAGEALLDDADAAAQRTTLGLGTAATAATGDFAAASHSHELTALAATGATNGHVLTANGSNGVTFAALPASGVTGAASSASDVLGVSGSNITGVDANADRIVYWNNTSNKLAYGTPADAGAAAASHTHAASDITSGTIDTARLASGTANSGTFLRGDQTWAAVSGVTTGSVDNAILRADGTGGSTSQSSDINILDSTTSTQNNVAITNQHSGQTNSALVLTPKGTGAFILGPRPTGTASTGNARGANAVDLMTDRTGATQVASGEGSFAAGARHVVSGFRAACVGGYGSTASNDNAVTLGALNTATGSTAGSLCGYFNNATATESVVVGGNTNNATAARSAAIGGNNNTASADSAICLGGQNAAANRFCIHAHAAGQFAAQGDAQRIRAVLRCKTTTNAAVEMGLNGSTTYLTIPSGKVIFCNIKVVGVKSDGSVVATYERQYAAKNVAGTSSEVYAAVTIGTDNAASTSLEVATVDAGDYIRIRPTGIASETWRWVASVDAVEVAYGT